MSDITQADRLVNEPITITLGDGKTRELNFGFRGLRRIDKQFGGVQALAQTLAEPLGPGWTDAIFLGLHIGLWKLKLTEDQLEGLIDTDDLVDYSVALMESLGQNFPRQIRTDFLRDVQKGKDELLALDEPPSEPETLQRTPGTTVTTLRPPSSEEVTTSSVT